MPLYMRIPKLRGFTSKRPTVYSIYTSQLNDSGGTSVDNKSLYEAGLIPSEFVKVKIIKKGELKKKLTVKVQKASANAEQAIKKAGGSFIAVDLPKRAKKAKKTDQKEN